VLVSVTKLFSLEREVAGARPLQIGFCASTGKSLSEQPSAKGSWTAIGLAIALLGIPLVTISFRSAVGEIATIGQMALREFTIFALLGLLLVIVRRGERLPWSSIGMQRGRAGQSLLWGLLAFILLGVGTVAALGLLSITGLPYGGSHAFVPPLWLTAIVVIRAGVVEEVFYRGYAIERMKLLTGSRAAAALLPLVAFALFHYRGGIGGVLIALILGAILTGFYLWRRDLKANIVAHFLIDFLPNVLLPMLAG
jgi:membrane protease YdiL (CAAX protease family)